jgi:hypothetical protein
MTLKMNKFSKILILSSWGFVIAITSSLFFYVGVLIDERFGTEPSFMLGLLFLAIFLAVGRLFKEAWEKKDG